MTVNKSNKMEEFSWNTNKKYKENNEKTMRNSIVVLMRFEWDSFVFHPVISISRFRDPQRINFTNNNN